MIVPALLIGVRIYFVNCDVVLPATVEYQIGETLPFENDYNGSAADASPGYTMRISEYELLTTEDFVARYHIEGGLRGNDWNRYYLLAHASFANEGDTADEEHGIALNEIRLIGIDWMSYLDEQAFGIVNPDMTGAAFSLKPHTRIEMILTYPINPRTMKEADEVTDGDLWLNVTEYPTRKMIRLHENKSR